MDIPALKDVELRGGQSPVRIPTGIFGPLPAGTFGLLTGRSSLNQKGITVHLGIIDADYTGEIQILMSSLTDYKLLKGERIAQLILLPYIPIGSSVVQRTGGFGSTNPINVMWTAKLSQQQPLINIFIEHKKIQALIDTGSDITIVKPTDWPSHITYTIIPCNIKGVSKTPVNTIGQATMHIHIKNEEGQVAVIKPYILEVPVSILGRDVLEQWGAYIHF